MRKIILLCSAGMSTSILVRKMEEAASKEGYDVTIAAFAVTEASSAAATADIVLLGPQVRFNLEQIRKQLPDTPVEVIDMRAYGTLNGAAVIKQVKKALNDE